MNFPTKSKRCLEILRSFQEERFAATPFLQEAGQHSERMEAALRMVLAFHSAERWDIQRNLEWHNLQVQAGRGRVTDGATTKVLCDTIREVLGLQEEVYP